MPALRSVPPTPNPPMTCHTRNRAVPTATVVWSEKELPEARSITHGEDTDLASAEFRPARRRDTASAPDPPAAARVRQAPTLSLHQSSAQIQAQAAGIDI